MLRVRHLYLDAFQLSSERHLEKFRFNLKAAASNLCVRLHLTSSGTAHFLPSEIRWVRYHFDFISVLT